MTFDAYVVGVTDMTLPDFFATVTAPEVRLLTEDGTVVASFDTSETWWRQDFTEAFGKSKRASLTEDGE